MVAAASKFVEWFWLSGAARSVRADKSVPTPRLLELTGRAALAREAAMRTARPPEPFAHPGKEALAAELYRQSIHWCLLAHAGATDPAAAGAGDAPDTSIAALLERVDPALLERAAGGEAALARTRSRLVAATYRELAELEPAEQRETLEAFTRLAEGLLEPLSGAQRRLERIWARRVLHVLGVAGLALAIGLGARQFSRWQERRHDLAPHASWKASSAYPLGGCKSPEQHCPGGENYFFHTAQESDPSIVFDLGKERRISTVEVENRLDCCFERANPLAIAVSTDGKTWKEVARHKSEFTTLRESFRPVRARYVKLHVPLPSAILHLSRVRIYP